MSDAKKEVVENWSASFLDLSVYGRNKLFKICGPFLLGIEITSLPGVTKKYRPHFVVYPLWKMSITQCVEEPVFTQEICNKRGFQFSISYADHARFFQEAVECTKRQASILGHDHVSISQLFEVFDQQFSQTLIMTSPVGQAKLYEAKLLGALYVNDMSLAGQVLSAINNASIHWSLSLFEWKYGKLDVWLQGLQEMLVSRDGFLKQIEANRQDKKISQLQSSELAAATNSHSGAAQKLVALVKKVQKSWSQSSEHGYKLSEEGVEINIMPESSGIIWLIDIKGLWLGVSSDRRWLTNYKGDIETIVDSIDMIPLLPLLEIGRQKTFEQLSEISKDRRDVDVVGTFPEAMLLKCTFEHSVSDYWPMQGLQWLESSPRSLISSLEDTLDELQKNRAATQPLRHKIKRILKNHRKYE